MVPPGSRILLKSKGACTGIETTLSRMMARTASAHAQALDQCFAFGYELAVKAPVLDENQNLVGYAAAAPEGLVSVPVEWIEEVTPPREGDEPTALNVDSIEMGVPTIGNVPPEKPQTLAEKLIRKVELDGEPGLSMEAVPPGGGGEDSLHVKGAKDDRGKPPVGMIFEYFPRALLAVANVAGFGALKYTRGGWVEVPDGQYRYEDALGRHLLKRHIEGNNDLESELPHLAHAAWNALAILELALRDADVPPV